MITICAGVLHVLQHVFGLDPRALRPDPDLREAQMRVARLERLTAEKELMGVREQQQRRRDGGGGD